jgi:hypothetical protein
MNATQSKLSCPRTTLSPLMLATLLVVGYCGCGGPAEELPKTFPVTGRVVNKAGKPVTIGMVEFASIKDEKIQAVGKLQPDGTFSLLTAIGKEALPGAVEGGHKVTFLPGTQSQQPAYFKETYNVTSGPNHFRITYPY